MKKITPCRSSRQRVKGLVRLLGGSVRGRRLVMHARVTARVGGWPWRGDDPRLELKSREKVGGQLKVTCYNLWAGLRNYGQVYCRNKPCSQGKCLVEEGKQTIAGFSRVKCMGCMHRDGSVSCVGKGPSLSMGLHATELANEPWGRRATAVLRPRCWAGC